ncbi:YbaB/EbfC family nucleoid-associated protein [Glycomyces sp. L485]|uniref:YbaB/EbfC family nucleoid-associated protein n=1 Tax=Glycomyces sp. L485 TaxID=2909235 RepID=UPI001F4AA9B6|nr:YbaB/EbfC family nucleoid-associated protein [Glycomyces sp. L485]MCH7229382.1 YbaB/EbfC family nucleoid-associated protein [Glycomyces sp. L485]
MDQQGNMPDAAAIQRLVAEAEAEAVSDNAAVRVVAGPGGQIKDLDLRHNAFKMSGVELGEMIVETIKAANSAVDRELSEAIGRETGMTLPSDVFGGGMPTREELEEER